MSKYVGSVYTNTTPHEFKIHLRTRVGLAADARCKQIWLSELRIDPNKLELKGQARNHGEKMLILREEMQVFVAETAPLRRRAGSLSEEERRRILEAEARRIREGQRMLQRDTEAAAEATSLQEAERAAAEAYWEAPEATQDQMHRVALQCSIMLLPAQNLLRQPHRTKKDGPSTTRPWPPPITMSKPTWTPSAVSLTGGATDVKGVNQERVIGLERQRGKTQETGEPRPMTGLSLFAISSMRTGIE
ncbi:hypothetical protein BD779DRAFT_1466192 [Infundibulicybe gibba]|nr:hypothetical protein BD779DRAFT_1466192 [Infundibulicybe gibba]